MTTVLIIEDQTLFSDVIRSALTEAGMNVVGCCTTGEAGLKAACVHMPDVILVDIGLPGSSGLIIGRQIAGELPNSCIIAVTALTDRRLVGEAMRGGFSGYLTKDLSASRFINAIREILAGQAVLPRERRVDSGRTVSTASIPSFLAAQLTARELQVLSLLASGTTGSEIATRLALSPNTIRTHVQNVLTKLQVHSRLEAVTFALRHGIVRQEDDLGVGSVA